MEPLSKVTCYKWFDKIKNQKCVGDFCEIEVIEKIEGVQMGC